MPLPHRRHVLGSGDGCFFGPHRHFTSRVHGPAGRVFSAYRKVLSEVTPL